MMNAEIKAVWVAALRSGEYKQGYGQLWNRHDDSYCCLGVLTDLAITAGIEAQLLPSLHNDALVLQESVRNWAELDAVDPWIEQGGDSLSQLNDTECWSFDEIADAIENDVTL